MKIDSNTDKKENIEKIVINSLEQIDFHRSDWEGLLKSTNSTNIYSDPIFFSKMYKFRAESAIPHIVLFYIQNKLSGMIIGWKAEKINPYKIGYFKFHSPKLSSLVVEIGGIISDGKDLTNEEITKYLANQLQSRKIDLLNINHIFHSHPLWNLLIEGNSLTSKPLFNNSINWIARIRDGETGDKIENNSSKTLNGIRRRERKLLTYFKNELEIVDCSNTTNIELFINSADSISKQSYQYAINVGIKNTPKWHQIICSLAENNFLGAYLLMNNDIPISYIFGFKFKDVFYLYATAYDNKLNKYSPGEYLRNKVVDILIGEEINVIDFGYGEADYKRLYGTDGNEEASLHIYGFNLKAKFAKFLEKFSIYLNHVLLKVLNKIGILNYVKKNIRKMMTKTTT